LIALLVLLAGSALGGVSAGGYVKDVYQYSHSAFDGRPFFLNTSRVRLTLDARHAIFRSHVDYDHETLAGSFFRTRDFAASGFGETRSWLDEEKTLEAGDTWLWRHRLYRGWAGVETRRVTARFGRQRVSWGTGKLWNPTDVLNPYQPLSVEREERRGVDAFYARAVLGQLSQAELAWAPRDVWVEHALLGRLKSHLGEYDGSVMGGKVAGSTGSWIAGGDFAGNLAGGTLHGEWSYTAPQTRAPFWKAGIGYDYTLDDATLVVEYLHSGSGSLDTRRYDLGALLAGREVTLAQDYVGATWSKDVHPLLKLELVLLTNVNDGSQFAGPTLQWNARKDLYVTAGLQRFGGPKRTEYGRAANLSFLQGQYFF
jgi:hypothetical protein